MSTFFPIGMWITSIGLGIVAALLPSPAEANGAPATAIYGIASDNNIYAMDPLTGQTTETISTASLSLTGSLANAFALNRDRSQVYFLSSDKILYFWDRPSGALGQVATAADLGLETAALPRNATFFSDRFWFIDAGDNLLRSAVIAFGTNGLPSGAALQSPLTVTGVTGFLNPNDIIYNPTAQKIFGSDLSGATNNFFEIDMSSLTGSRPSTALYAQPGGVGLQLAYDSEFSVLYGANFETGQWYTVDTFSGGTFNAISGAVTPEAFRMRDLAGGLVAVPEPGTLALCGSGIVFGVGMMCRRRRRSGP
jgi:hypothetical protein